MRSQKIQVLFQKRLLLWYAKSQRLLPWRQTHDPYAITVSELMLQQTQVDRVVPKFEAWMKTFPTIERLASAKRTEVIALWQGLGYNRRALYLQRIAQTVLTIHNGVFPNTITGLRSLPGIGPYTAGAVMSFAYRANEPLVDTNVQRVLGRIFFGYKQLQKTPTEKLWALATQVLPKNNQAYFFNQGLMDFGAMICTARKPKCQECPMKSLCASYPAITHASPKELRLTKTPNETQYFGLPRRIWRGKILRYLHSIDSKGATPLQIGKALQGDFSASRLPWLQSVLLTLSKDGFISFSHNNKRVILSPK